MKHYVALSVVGTERIPDSPYLRAKNAQETLIKGGGIPYSIIHATQFFEFVKRIADEATVGTTVRLPPVLIQPMAADDVAKAVGRIAVGTPVNGTVEVAGPQQFRFDELIRQGLGARNDPREVVVDPHARYFGAELGERSLIPAGDARLGEIRFQEWLGSRRSSSDSTVRQALRRRCTGAAPQLSWPFLVQSARNRYQSLMDFGCARAHSLPATRVKGGSNETDRCETHLRSLTVWGTPCS